MMMCLGALLLTVACGGGSKEKAEEETQQAVQEAPKPRTIYTDSMTVSNAVEGTSMSYTFSRRPDESQQKVVDSETRDTYVDNCYSVTVKRGEDVIYSKKLTKQDFISQLDESMKTNSIFDGFRFDRYEDGKMYFNVCFSDAFTYDLSQPFILCIGPDGSSTIQRDNRLDLE